VVVAVKQLDSVAVSIIRPLNGRGVLLGARDLRVGRRESQIREYRHQPSQRVVQKTLISHGYM